MASCEWLAHCLFFNGRMDARPATAGLYMQSYCNGSSYRCARHMVFRALGRESVPADLYPNEQARAERIIIEAQPVR